MLQLLSNPFGNPAVIGVFLDTEINGLRGCLQSKVPFHETFLHGLIYGKSYWRKTPQDPAYVKPEEKKKFDLGKP